MNSTIAGLCILTAVDGLLSLLHLLRQLFTNNAPRVGREGTSALFQSPVTRELWLLREDVPGAYVGSDECRYAEGVNLEHAREDEKHGIALPRECGPSDPVPLHNSGLSRLRLLRSLTGVLLLSPACMLVMSNYAASRGLLQEFGGFESYVSFEF